MTVSVRIRGIYATALTALLAANRRVVEPSTAVADRFDRAFAPGPPDVIVRDTPEREGVGVVGTHEGVAAVTDDLDVGRETFAWSATCPRGALFVGRIAETLGSGAVVDLGAAEGFLPFAAVDGYVEVGDDVVVQVTAGRPPWHGDRPVLGTSIRVEAGPVSLRRTEGATPHDGVARTDVLAADPPPGWTARWEDTADDVPLAVLEAGLERASERASAIDGVLPAAGDDPHRLDEGRAGSWVWFGRESRFALDDSRRTVTPTLPGHHRIKVVGSEARTAVDFVEAVAGEDLPADRDAFAFGTVADLFGPRPGDRLEIVHGKPEGRCLTLGHGEVTDVDEDGQVTLRRELSGGGSYDGLDVPRRAGDVAITRIREGRWWYPTVYRSDDGVVRGTYVNVCTPVEAFPDRVRYVDLHVDVVRHADGTVDRLDDDELDAAVAAGHVTDALADAARSVADRVESALADRT